MSDNSEPKIPYTPSQIKRFEISSDPFSRERLAKVLEAYKQLKQEISFFAGITLFGSLSKGRKLDEHSARYSDINFVAFIDGDQYEKTIDEYERNNPEFKKVLDYVLKYKPGSLSDDMERVRPDNVRKATQVYVAKRVREILSGRSESSRDAENAYGMMKQILLV